MSFINIPLTLHVIFVGQKHIFLPYNGNMPILCPTMPHLKNTTPMSGKQAKNISYCEDMHAWHENEQCWYETSKTTLDRTFLEFKIGPYKTNR